jgi:hypothetical protein
MSADPTFPEKSEALYKNQEQERRLFGKAHSSMLSRSSRLSASGLLQNPDALLTRGDLRELELGRRAVDSVFRELDVIVLPGYSRPLVRASDFREFLERSTYANGRRVR